MEQLPNTVRCNSVYVFEMHRLSHCCKLEDAQRSVPYSSANLRGRSGRHDEVTATIPKMDEQNFTVQRSVHCTYCSSCDSRRYRSRSYYIAKDEYRHLLD